MRLLIVIVNYRTAGLTLECLRSLHGQIAPGARIMVADNASGDDSVPRLSEAIATEPWGRFVTLIPLANNGGFAFGNNAAIRPALQSDDPPDYVLLLNPDTLVRPGAIEALLAFMDANPRAGIAGSRLEDPDGTPQRSAFRFPTVASELDGGLRLGPVTRLLSRWIVAPPVPPEPTQTDWVAGASMIIRRGVFRDVGLMDERYFMYYEEVDFCHRARRAGWECWYVPASRVIHLVGQASGVTDTRRPPKRRPPYWFDSRRRYFLRNHNPAYAAWADAAWAAGFACWRARRRLQRKPDADPPRLLADFLRHSVFVKGFRD